MLHSGGFLLRLRLGCQASFFIHQRIFAIFKIFRSLQLRLFYNLGTERCSVFCFYTSLCVLFLVKQFHIVCRTFLLLTKVFLHKGKQVAEIRELFYFSFVVSVYYPVFGFVVVFKDYTSTCFFTHKNFLLLFRQHS